MENNQFNPQAGQQNPMPQPGQPTGQQFAQPQQGQPMGQQPQPMQGQQPMGQRPAQPQQGQPMGQQPQPMQGQQPMGQRPTQPQQGQPMGQRPAQPMQGQQPMGQRPTQPMQGQQPMGQRPAQPMQGQQPQQFAQPMPQAAPKAPMSMETRSLFIGISLLVVAVVLFTLSPIKNRYFDNSALGTFNSIFTSLFSLANFAFLLVALVVGTLLFVPKWSKQFLDYANSRLIILVTAGTAAILSLVHFIMVLTDTIQTNGLYGEFVKKVTDSGLKLENYSLAAPEAFKLDFFLIPVAIGLAIVALVFALPLLKKPLKKDRFLLGLVIISIALLAALLFVFIFFFLGKAGLSLKPFIEVSKYFG